MEKCIRQLPQVRVPESLETALMRLAAGHERTLSEYIKLVLSHHVFGHAVTIDAHASDSNQDRATQ
jgi:hypothetical protein